MVFDSSLSVLDTSINGMFQSMSNIVLGYFCSQFFKFSFVFIDCRLFEGITFVFEFMPYFTYRCRSLRSGNRILFLLKLSIHLHNFTE